MPPEPGEWAPRILIRNGRVLRGAEAVPASLAVLVEDGTIRAPAPEAGFTGAEVDLAGNNLLPGLIDCHLHLTIPGDGPAAAGGEIDLAALTPGALEITQMAPLGGHVRTGRPPHRDG